MDKVKKIFSPGHSKDDEVMYGDSAPETGRKHSTASSSQDPEKKEHSILRQVLNPNGANYDEEAFGPPQAAAEGPTLPTVEQDAHLETLPEAKKHEHSVLRQIFNPHGDRYDEQAFGTTAVVEDPNAPKDPTQLETLPEAKKNEHNVLRQILNPGGANYDEQAYGTTAVAPGAEAGRTAESSSAPVQGATTLGTESRAANEPSVAAAQPGTAQSNVRPDFDQKSAMSIKSGVEGPYAREANIQQVGLQSARTNPVTDVSKNNNIPYSTSEAGGPSSESATNAFGAHFGRDATLAGAGLASGGAVASELDNSTSLQGPWTKPNMKTDEPAQPGTLSSSTEPGYEGRFQPTGTGAATNPQLNTAPSDVAQATFTARSYKLGDSSTTAPSTEPSNAAQTSTGLGAAGTAISTTGVGNTPQTPHVPGEFPLESGEDPHGSHIGPATAAARAAAAEPGASGFSSRTGTTAAQPSASSTAAVSSQRDVDREAAFAGAAGAFGIGAYDVPTTREEGTVPAVPSAATNVTILGRNLDSSDPVGTQSVPTSPLQPIPDSTHATTHVTILGRNLDAPGSTNDQATTIPSTQPTSTAVQPDDSVASSSGHHFARDAALVGGAGAAGVGAYDLTKDKGLPTGTAPASTETQPSVTSQAVRNQDPAGSTADSSTTSKPAEHHYARDAAVAGGVGAAGAGVYETAKHHGDTGPASNTAGPHESNVANVVDPRVQPDPAPVLDKKEAKKQEKEAEKEAKAQEKAHAKELKEQEKAHEKEVKAQEKEAKKEAKAQEKAHAKEVKEQEKEAKKQEKAHEKELKAQEKEAKKEAKVEEKARAKEEKEREKEEKEREKEEKEREKEEKERDEESHRGRDAAVAGGAGAAAGAGAYELSKDHDGTGPASKTIGPHESNAANVVDPRVQPDPEKMKDSTTAGPHRSDLANKLDPNVESDPSKAQQQDSHLGRDAAVAGGAGAAGVGAYEYGKDRGDTGPASNTIGPHESNVANVMDPRVQPDPEKMKDSTTSGPHRSDMANRADPRVESDASRTPQNQQSGHGNNYSRAPEMAAAGAGVGALGESGIQRRDTGPASKTIGPHKSNILNILDPRVKPDTELMKEEERLTTGPHRSDIANLLDPRVRSNAGQTQQRSSSEQHSGRDAALGAGAGAAAGAATYETGSEDKHKHNKLHKPRPDEVSEKSSEKSEKQGFFSKILHPGRKSSEGRRSSEEAGRSSQSRDIERSGHPAGGAAATTGAVAGASSSQGAPGTTTTTGLPNDPAQAGPGRDGVLIEPHTGLPMNVGKYGTYGAGGTDAAPQIAGYHETDPALRNATIGTATGADSGHGARPGEEGVAGPDWDAQKKQNTLY